MTIFSFLARNFLFFPLIPVCCPSVDEKSSQIFSLFSPFFFSISRFQIFPSFIFATRIFTISHYLRNSFSFDLFPTFCGERMKRRNSRGQPELTRRHMNHHNGMSHLLSQNTVFLACYATRKYTRKVFFYIFGLDLEETWSNIGTGSAFNRWHYITLKK